MSPEVSAALIGRRSSSAPTGNSKFEFPAKTHRGSEKENRTRRRGFVGCSAGKIWPTTQERMGKEKEVGGLEVEGGKRTGKGMARGRNPGSNDEGA